MIRKCLMVLLAVMLCAVTATAAADGEIGFREVKLISQLFNGAAVGKTVIPAGWNITVTEYTLNDQLSITWPNAMKVTASSPDGSVTMIYVSRMDFQQQSVYGLGAESQSADGSYDQSQMICTLNYRDAAATCDYLMVSFYPDTVHTVLEQRPVTDAENEALYRYWQAYDSGIRNVYSQAEGSGAEVKATNANIAERTYLSGSYKTVVNALVAGHQVLSQFSQMYTDTINWQINRSYIMQAPADVFEQYMDIFSIFELNTTTSQEYDSMTIQHSNYLWEYFQAVKAGTNPDPEQLSRNLSQSADESISQSDTYSIMDGWSDVIREENDYTLSSGSHIKLSTAFDHVYEDSDGNVYAGYGSFYPKGATELFPTPVGGN